MRAKVIVGPDGQVALPSREVAALAVAEGDAAELVTVRGAFALVSPARKADAWFAGTLTAVSFAEVAQMLLSSLRSGVLLLSREGGRGTGGPEELRRKAIYFREGQVVFASSSDPSDRLGNVLWRRGVLSTEDLERCTPMVKAGRPLGQVLVDVGVLTSAQVYEGVIAQVREIFLGAFHDVSGDFVFREGPSDERNAVRLGERTRDLLLAGLKRVDEIDRIQAAEAPDLEAPLRTAGRPPADLDFRLARLLGSADGHRGARAAIDGSGLGFYEGMKALAGLVRAGLVQPIPAPPAAAPEPAPEQPAAIPAAPKAAPGQPAATAAAPEPEPTSARPGREPGPGGRPFETYARIIEKVYFTLRKVNPQARSRLNGWLDQLPERERVFFEGVRLDGEGYLDVARVLLNAKATGRYPGAASRARALEAIEAFLRFELFEVKSVLAPAEAETLLREVGRMQAGKA